MLHTIVIFLISIVGDIQEPKSEAIRLDVKGRPVVAMRLDDRGPFDMLVDTAAQTSVMTTALVESLGVAPSDARITVNGVAGPMDAKLYPLRRMTTALFDLHDITLVALPRIGVTDARGLIGIDLFADRKLVFDLARKRLSVEPSAPAVGGYVAIKGATSSKGLLTVPITVDGVVIDALVDTGAEGSVANAAALRALGWREDDPRLKANGTITGATIGDAVVRRGVVGKVTLGPVSFRGVPLTFTRQADAAPRIILGMDMLGLLQRFALDLPRGELQVYIPPLPKG